jgi:hypothetical protein
MNTSLKRALTGVAVATACILAGTANAAGPASPTDAESGSWQRHEFTFPYMGFTSIYSCEGLVDKVKLLLIVAGARGDAKVTESGCTRTEGGPDRMASARLVFYTLGPRAGADEEQVPGLWRDVAVAANRPRDIQAGDCELVEQFRETVLTKFFTIRNLRDKTTCIPHQVAGTIIDLQFEVLAPPPGVKTR